MYHNRSASRTHCAHKARGADEDREDRSLPSYSSSHSLIVVTRLNAIDALQAQANTFESVDTLSDSVAQSLAAIGECLTLLRRDKQLRQNYTAARRRVSDAGKVALVSASQPCDPDHESSVNCGLRRQKKIVYCRSCSKGIDGDDSRRTAGAS